MAARCRVFTGGNAPWRSPEGLWSERPVAIAYLKTCPQIRRTRCAASKAPRCSIRRITVSNSGAEISPMGLLPIHGKTFFSSRLITFALWLSAQFGECLANHSRATTSKLLACRSALVALITLRYSLGSTSLASSFRASSRRSRASFRETSG